MKLLTLNFLTCARASCKSSPSSFPLHPRSAVLEVAETPLNPLLLVNILPRLSWPALRTVASELGLPGLTEEPPEEEDLWEDNGGTQPTYTAPGSSLDGSGYLTSQSSVLESAQSQEVGSQGGGTQPRTQVEREPSRLARDLHRVLLETCVKEGLLVCGNCGHEYAVKEGIANFLLPAHMV